LSQCRSDPLGRVGRARHYNVNLSELNFDLPPERIAQKPLAERAASRMLLLERASGAWEDRYFREFPALLRGDELIVVNNARVIPARLFGRRMGIHAEAPGRNNPASGEFLQASIEVLLVRQLSPLTWETLVRPGRKIPTGERIIFGDGELEGTVEGRGEYGVRIIRFSSKTDFHEAVGRLGHIPLPPYIKREDESLDRERYQTIFAKRGAAVAAPTAGLHFTPAILDELRGRGIEIVEITLEVGLGTFEPVRTERIEDHKIHKEPYEISELAAAAITGALREKRPVLAVGTTVVRALEDAAEKGSGEVNAGKAEAEILLYPGKAFRIVDQLLTNFHLPGSSLLAMVAAFAGRDNILRAYAHAMQSEYRFYSYGDCMLIR
jgi:S-adenosylmethionine:tRNA ribosyltransferase-isomerase